MYKRQILLRLQVGRRVNQKSTTNRSNRATEEQIGTGTGLGLFGGILLGIVGAIVGGWLFQALGLSIGGGIIGAFVPALGGAVLVLLAVKAIKRA